MATQHFLPKNRKSIYHRIRIPRQLQPYFAGREELWRSLKTNDKDEARTRTAHWESRAQRVFSALRKHGGHMTQDEREVLVAHWLERELDKAEDARTLAGPFSDDYREGVWHVLSDQLDDAHEALVTNNWRKVEQEADELLKAAGLPALDRDSGDFARLCRRLLQAKRRSPSKKVSRIWSTCRFVLR